MAQRATTTLSTGSSSRRSWVRRFAGSPVQPANPPTRQPVHGLTLVEVLISVAILAAGAGIVLQALARGAHALAAARNRAAAYTFSASKLADLQQRLDQGEVEKTAGQFGTRAGQFDWRVDAAALAGAPDVELVTLTVAWKQGRHDYAEQFSLVHRLPENAP